MAGAASILWAHRVYEEINARKLSGHWPGPFKILLRCAVSNTHNRAFESRSVFFSRRDSRVPIDLINDPRVNYTPGSWLRRNFPHAVWNLICRLITLHRSIISRKWMNRCIASFFSRLKRKKLRLAKWWKFCLFNEITTLMQLLITNNWISISILHFYSQKLEYSILSTNRNKISNFPIRKDPTNFQQTNETFSLKIEK